MVTEEHRLCMGCMSRLDESGRCRCGYDEAVPTDPACLPLRTVLAERYLLGRAFSMNGEGITYIAYDAQNEERVFIREFMPPALAHRNEFTGVVMPYSGMETQYKTLLSDFLDLSNLLKNMRECENLVPVMEVFSERATCYAVYKYVKTISYGEYLLHNGGEFTWAQVKKLFMPFFTTISNLHLCGLIHRGISPESIRVNAKGQLMLCGFAIAALRTINGGLEPELFPGYTAPEQYSLSVWQGTWTDVYSLAAVLYKSLTGTLPADAMARRDVDGLCPAERLNPYIPLNVVRAIGHAMEVQVDQRTQSVDKFTAELLESAESNTAIYVAPPRGEEGGYTLGMDDNEVFPERLPEHAPSRRQKSGRPTKQDSRREKEPKKQKRRPVALIACLLSMLVLITIVILILRDFQTGRQDSDSTSTSSQSQSVSGEASGNVTVPNFVGRMRENVEGNADYSQFTLIFEEKYNEEYSKGMVYEQSVLPKVEVTPGMEITLFVSKGAETVPMPLVLGKTLEEAEAILTELGIKYQLMPRYDSSYEYNVIAKQNVEEGTEVPVGGTKARVFLDYGARDSSSHITVDDGESSDESYDGDMHVASKRE